MSSYDGTFKIVLLSAPEVDKSCMLAGCLTEIPQPDDQKTIGIEFLAKDIVNDKYKIRLMLFDLKGEERFRFLWPIYCSGASAAFLLYDVTKPQTLNHIGDLVSIVRQKSGDVPISLIGIIPNENSKRQVSAEEGVKIAEEIKLNSFIEIKALTGENVGEAYETITRLILAHLEYDLPQKLYKDIPESTKYTQRSSELKSKRIDKDDDDDNDDDDAHHPYPYIFKPPEPPDDFAMAPQLLIRPILIEKDPEGETNCQYCGIKLTKEEYSTHSCKKTLNKKNFEKKKKCGILHYFSNLILVKKRQNCEIYMDKIS